MSQEHPVMTIGLTICHLELVCKRNILGYILVVIPVQFVPINVGLFVHFAW